MVRYIVSTGDWNFLSRYERESPTRNPAIMSCGSRSAWVLGCIGTIVKNPGFWWSFWDATPGGPGWASTRYYMQKLVYVQFRSLWWFYSVKWEDIDPFRYRPSFKLFLTISEHRFWIRFQKFIAKSTIVADSLRNLHQGDDKVKFNWFDLNSDIIRKDIFTPNIVNFTTEVERRQDLLSGFNFQCLTSWSGIGLNSNKIKRTYLETTCRKWYVTWNTRLNFDLPLRRIILS
jgi:hypothetical protein